MEPIRIVCSIKAVHLDKEGNPLTAVSTQTVETTRTGHLHAECPRCGAHALKRKPRAGILQRKIFSLFGYYPWKCSRCGGGFLLKKRGTKRRRNRPESRDEVTA